MKDEPEPLNNLTIERGRVSGVRVANDAQHLPQYHGAAFVVDLRERSHRTHTPGLPGLTHLQALAFDRAPDIALTRPIRGAGDVELLKQTDRPPIITTKEDIRCFTVSQIAIDLTFQVALLKAVCFERPDPMLSIEHPVDAIAMIDNRDPQFVQIEVGRIILGLRFAKAALRHARRRI